MTLAEVIVGWRDFYSAVANAGAALVGLVFVGVSIHMSGRSLDRHTRLLGLESTINLLYPLLAALVMLIPAEPAVQGGGLLFGALASAPPLVSIAYIQARLPRGESRLWLAYRYFIPLGAFVVIVAGAVGLISGWEWAVYAPAVYVFLMLIVGIQNAWDLLLKFREEPRNR